MKASIVIANFNNANFIKECIESLNSQTYKDFEVIFFDDNSKDNSLEIIKEFKNVIVIKNTIQTSFGSLNQINAFKKAIELTTGEIIFFLDSDDYFHKNKIEKIISKFSDDKNKMIIFDYPIILNKNREILKRKKNSIFQSYWGYIHPTSCISIRKNFVKKVFDSISGNKFTDIWFDLRILLFAKYLHNYNVIDDNLTYYRQTEGNVSSKFSKYSKKWWKRRGEAHNYYFNFMNNNNLKIQKNLDFYITKIINTFI